MNNRVFRFRGKGIKSNAWFYGGYTTDWNDEYENEFYISVGLDAIQVKKETIGQYTGIKDKNEKEIYEGDVIEENGIYRRAVIRFGRYYTSRCSLDAGHVGFYVDFIEFKDEDGPRKDLGYWSSKSEVVGNIYDNPELLKEGRR